MSSRSSKRYPPALRERAVRVVAECRHEHASGWATIESVAAKLGIGGDIPPADLEAATAVTTEPGDRPSAQTSKPPEPPGDSDACTEGTTAPRRGDDVW